MPMPTRIFRRIITALCVIAFGASLSAQITTFSGTVYSPLGSPTSNPTNPGDPIPNILVFVVNPAYPPPTFTQGVVTPTGTQTGCQAQPLLVPAQVLGNATTGADGTFSFPVSGALPTPNVILVIQAGKWRRQYSIPTSSITLGGTYTNNNLAMPPQSGTLSDGSVADLPYIAVVTGEADGIECIFRQIGISDSVVGAPGSGAHIVLYPADGAAQEGAFPPNYNKVTEKTLVNTPATLNEYDLIMFGCQGGTGDTDVAKDANNLTAYVNDSGRVFATHYEYLWLSENSTFEPVANGWGGTGSINGNPPATINTTTFSGGPLLAAWMANIGALASNPPPVVDLTNVRINTTSLNSPAVSWANLNSDDVSMQFTFDTPIGAAGTPTRPRPI